MEEIEIMSWLTLDAIKKKAKVVEMVGNLQTGHNMSVFGIIEEDYLELCYSDSAANYLRRYEDRDEFDSALEERKEELPYYYPALFKKVLDLWEELLDYPYFRRLRRQSDPPTLPYRRRVWQLMLLGERLVQDLAAQHRQIEAESGRGVVLPLILPGKPRVPVPGQT